MQGVCVVAGVMWLGCGRCGGVQGLNVVAGVMIMVWVWQEL